MTASRELAYFDYLKAAFAYRPRVPGLGSMPVNEMALAGFGVLGMLNPGFWLLGAAGEIGYLLWLSTNERFQAIVRGRNARDASKSYQEKIDAGLARLTRPDRHRYRALLKECLAIRDISITLEMGDGPGFESLRIGGLNKLLWIFLRLLISRQLLRDSIDGVNEDKLGTRVADLESKIAGAEPDSPLAQSLHRTLDIQKSRRSNLDRAKETLAVVDAELARIEGQVMLIREETVVSGKTGVLSGHLDAVSSTLSQTNRWMEQQSEIFADLGGDPLGTTPEDLPEMPAEPEEPEELQ